MSKKEYEKIITPAGIAKYPRLNKPETQVNGKDVEPRFKITVVIDEATPGAPEFLARIQKLHDAAIAAANKALKPGKKLTINNTIRPHVNDEGEVVEGKFEVSAKTRAFREDGTPKSVPMFDAKGKPIKANVGGGSKVKVSVTPDAYNSTMGAGVTLYLNGVQVLDLKEFTGGASAKGCGFGEEEGYSADEDDGGQEFPDDAATGGEESAPEPEAEKSTRRKGDF